MHIDKTMVTSQEIEDIARETIGFPSRRKWGTPAVTKARLTSFFGCNKDVIANLWNRIEPTEHRHWSWILLPLQIWPQVHTIK